MHLHQLLPVLAAVAPALACDSCYGPQGDVVMTRLVRRMQPGVPMATTKPRAPLEWGQINFMHTSDTHGWLAGHLKEANYGADWGDFANFVKHMRALAAERKVDLLLIDTGDLHDGNGLGDATVPNGAVSMPIFQEIDYDIATIGNHELYVSEVAYDTFYNFSRVYGEKYLTSNVDIRNPATGQFESIGRRYRYFTTPNGLRIMAFGVLFDFRGNSNVSRVTPASEMVKQQWFKDALNYNETIDLFLLTGHNPTNPRTSSSTMPIVRDAIRNARPDVPIQVFGGHTHLRDFRVYDRASTGLESGRYCETLGWLAMSGIPSDTFTGQQRVYGVPFPRRPPIAVNNRTAPSNASAVPVSKVANLRYARRYLDWNLATFNYHAPGSQGKAEGQEISNDITEARERLNLTTIYGCAPETYCLSCKPFGDPLNIYSLVTEAARTVVVNESRADIPRFIIMNTGSIRFDIIKGPFTYDDSFIVSPFINRFRFIPNVPYSVASQVITTLNSQRTFAKRSLDLGIEFTPNGLMPRDSCVDPGLSRDRIMGRSYPTGRIIRRQSQVLTPGYNTTDDFGNDGDDTPHSTIPYFRQPAYVQANASLPAANDSSAEQPETVDFVYIDFIERDVLSALNSGGGGANYTAADASLYMPQNFSTNSYLPAYAKLAWQENMPNCPLGEAVGGQGISSENLS